MRQYIDILQDLSGNALAGGTCTVRTFPGGALASIFSDNGLTPIGTSIVTADVTGQFSFFVADGDYTLQLSFNGAIYKTQSPVTMFDGAPQVTFPDTGAANAYAVANSTYEKALRAGLRASFQAANSSTGASTFQYNTLAVKPIIYPGGAPIGAGAILATGIYPIEYDGASWQLRDAPGAPSTGYAKTGGETAAGATIVNAQYPPGTVDRYASNAIPGTTDMSAAFSMAFQVAGKGGCSVRWGATAPYLCSNPVNCTGIRGVVAYDESSFNLSANLPSVLFGHNGHGFDMATSTELTFNNAILANAPTFVPKSFFFSARSAGGGGCGLNRFNNCRSAFNSNFTWFWYGYGSEENTWYGCTVYNNQAGSGEFSHNQSNPSAYSSTFVAIAVGGQSNTENHHYGFGYYQLGNSGSQNEVIFQLENTGNFTARDGTWGVSHGLAYANVIGNTGSINLTFDSIRGEPLGGGQQPKYGISVNNTAGTSLGWTFNNVTADAQNELLHFNAAQTPNIQQLVMRASTATSGIVLVAYTMTNSLIETVGDSVITGAAGGTVGSNVFIGGRNNITLLGTVNPPNIYLDNNLGAVGIDGDSFVAASAACTGAITTASSYTARMSPNGKMVTLSLPSVLGTATAVTSFTFGTNLPAGYRPAANLRQAVIIEDNGGTPNQLGAVFINAATGAISVFKDILSTANFTAAPNAGLPGLTEVSWNL